MDDTAAKTLREPFPDEQVGKLPRLTCKACSENKTQKHCDRHQRTKCATCGNFISTAHIHLDYVGHAATTDRLIQVDPDWTWRPFTGDELIGVNAQKGELWIWLTVAGKTLPGVGDGDTAKVRIGDAIRNAAMRFGVALDLWAKEDLQHADDESTAASKPKAKPVPAPDPDFAPDAALIASLGEIDVLADALAVTRKTDKGKVLAALSKEIPEWRTDPVDASRAKARLAMWAEKAKEAA